MVNLPLDVLVTENHFQMPEFFLMHFTWIRKIRKDLKEKKIKPDAGLEPATVGLKVQRSTD